MPAPKPLAFHRRAVELALPSQKPVAGRACGRRSGSGLRLGLLGSRSHLRPSTPFARAYSSALTNRRAWYIC
jgi:hypothetical protein